MRQREAIADEGPRSFYVPLAEPGQLYHSSVMEEPGRGVCELCFAAPPVASVKYRDPSPHEIGCDLLLCASCWDREALTHPQPPNPQEAGDAR